MDLMVPPRNRAPSRDATRPKPKHLTEPRAFKVSDIGRFWRENIDGWVDQQQRGHRDGISSQGRRSER